MRTLVLIYFFVFTGIYSPAQTTNNIRVKAGNDVLETLAKEIYRYPSFADGIVFFRDGSSVSSKLNFNFLNGEMQFIDNRGDTLSIANENTVSLITIGNDSFFYDKGYIEQMLSGRSLKLARRQRIRVVDRQKIGAYDQASPASSITNFKSFTNGTSRNRTLDVREDILLSKETNYYIGDRFNHFFRANKKNLLGMFEKHQREIENFIKTAGTDFNKPEDLQKLVSYIGSL